MTTAADSSAKEPVLAPHVSSAPRTGVVWIPDWPVLVAATTSGVDLAQPIVVSTQRRVRAASGYARSSGIRTAMSLRAAQELCPHVLVLESSELSEAREFEYVAQVVERIVPTVEIVRPGLLSFGARGPTRYFGSEDALAETLANEITRALQVEAHVGFAEGLLAAILSARTMEHIAVGASREFLAQRPLAEALYAITQSAERVKLRELIGLWDRLGIRTFGQFAKLPRSHVHTRFGDQGAWLHDLATGRSEHQAATSTRNPDIEVHTTFEMPATRVDEATFYTKTLAESMYDTLIAHSASCGRILVQAHLSSGSVLQRSWRTDDSALGAMSPARLTQRVRWQLEGWLTNSTLRARAQTKERQGSAATENSAATLELPGIEITGLTLTAQEVIPAATHQEALWGVRAGENTQALRAIERAVALIGPHRVQSVELEAGRSYKQRVRTAHWDERAANTANTSDVGSGMSKSRQTGNRSIYPPESPGALPSPGPTILYDPALPIDVLDPRGQPVYFNNRLLMSNPPYWVIRPRSDGRGKERIIIGNWAGPWPITTKWWQEAVQHEIYVQLIPDGESQALLAVYRNGAWECDGLYD